MTLNMSTRSSNTLSMDFDNRTSANKSKFIKDRVTHVGKSFGSLCEDFGGLARKNGKLRDKQDELCRHLMEYSEQVSYNSSSKAAVEQVSKDLACCGDYQDCLVKRLESHVVEPLMIFDDVIKNSREEIQSAFNAYDKEQKSKKAVDTMRERNPSDRHKLNQAETELHKAQVHASRSAKALEEAIDTFEEKKLTDLKNTLGNYIRIHMSYHAKCLESLTKSYKSLAVMDPEVDLEEFRNILHPTSAIERQQMIRSVGGRGSHQSLTSQRSEQGLRSGGSRSATPKPTISKSTPTSKIDMFTAQGARPTASSKQSPAHKASPAKPSMRVNDYVSDSDDVSDSESGSELEDASPTYATIDKRRK
ncbi:CBY1-interacting BAR domain-containing protein 1-A-like [Watersipora subatra]|uniref:CBY1-interacting BAR domain-containing protein 1-A-like n=1 Tax=Watersipora subatra TaxID=2589382 RepID=UPI00355C94E2